MNVNDSDIIRSILLKSQDFGILFEETQVEMDAHVLLTNTCAIRENAENKVWQRLQDLRANDAKHPLDKMIKANSTDNDSLSFPGLQNQTNKPKKTKKGGRARRKGDRRRIIGVLGCTAERLKESVFQHGADLVVGPDAYRDLPRLVSALAPPPLPPPSSSAAQRQQLDQDEDDREFNSMTSPLERALNVQLSLEETVRSVFLYFSFSTYLSRTEDINLNTAHLIPLLYTLSSHIPLTSATLVSQHMLLPTHHSNLSVR